MGLSSVVVLRAEESTGHSLPPLVPRREPVTSLTLTIRRRLPPLLVLAVLYYGAKIAMRLLGFFMVWLQGVARVVAYQPK